MSTLHPARLAARFSPPLTEAVAGRLLAEPRFADRIEALFSLDVAPSASEADGILISLCREPLEQLAARAGVVLHARRILQEIRGPVISDFVAHFGEPALVAARAHADLSADRQAPEEGAEFQVIADDGMACLAAWLSDLPPILHMRVALSWPDDGSLPYTNDPVILSHGPQIMRRLALEQKDI